VELLALVVHLWVVVLQAQVLVLAPVVFLQVHLVAVQLEPADQCVHLVLALVVHLVLALVALVVRVLVAQAVLVVLVVRVLVVPVAGSVALVLVVLVADLVVLALVVLVAVVLVVEATVNAVRQRRSRVLVVVKTSMKCCHRQPRRIRRATHQFLKVLSLSNVVLRRKSLHRS
jgi:hypothetical protein